MYYKNLNVDVILNHKEYTIILQSEATAFINDIYNGIYHFSICKNKYPNILKQNLYLTEDFLQFFFLEIGKMNIKYMNFLSIEQINILFSLKKLSDYILDKYYIIMDIDYKRISGYFNLKEKK